MSRAATTEHGSYGFAYRHRCQCAPCREVMAVYQKRLRYDHTRGIRRLVPAEPTRKHLEMLLDAGASVYQIDRASGCNRINLGRILTGEFANVQRSTEERVLATTAQQSLNAAQRRVDSIGVRRRIAALEYLGHTKADIAVELGVSTAMTYDYTYSKFLFSDTVAAVHQVYLRMREREGSSDRVRWMAYKRGALPWMCWDDETIDDPDTVPYDACCVVVHCTRAVDKASLCTTHLRLVSAASNKLRVGRKYRAAVQRLNTRSAQDGKRTRRDIADLSEIGMSEKDIAFRLRLDDDYVAKLLRREAA